MNAGSDFGKKMGIFSFFGGILNESGFGAIYLVICPFEE
jgi:hypothetical protein